MTTFRILCRGGEILATERDWFTQLSGERVQATDLTTDNTVPGRGRVLVVRPIDPADGVLMCAQCGAVVDTVQALAAHGRRVHGRGLDGREMTTSHVRRNV